MTVSGWTTSAVLPVHHPVPSFARDLPSSGSGSVTAQTQTTRSRLLAQQKRKRREGSLFDGQHAPIFVPPASPITSVDSSSGSPSFSFSSASHGCFSPTLVSPTPSPQPLRPQLLVETVLPPPNISVARSTSARQGIQSPLSSDEYRALGLNITTFDTHTRERGADTPVITASPSTFYTCIPATAFASLFKISCDGRGQHTASYTPRPCSAPPTPVSTISLEVERPQMARKMSHDTTCQEENVMLERDVTVELISPLLALPTHWDELLACYPSPSDASLVSHRRSNSVDLWSLGTRRKSSVVELCSPSSCLEDDLEEEEAELLYATRERVSVGRDRVRYVNVQPEPWTRG